MILHTYTRTQYGTTYSRQINRGRPLISAVKPYNRVLEMHIHGVVTGNVLYWSFKKEAVLSLLL